MVLEEDLIKSVNHFRKGASIVLEAAVEWLFTEVHRICTAHKQNMPSKARKFRYPQVLWIAATYHDQYGNGKFLP